MSKKQKRASARARKSIRQLMGITGIIGHFLRTRQGDLIMFLIKPTNLGVLSDSSAAARVAALTTVLISTPGLELLCLNSRESFTNNKQFLKTRMAQEDNPAIRALLSQDICHLDDMQVQMSTAREFLLLVRMPAERDGTHYSISTTAQRIESQGFTVRCAGEADIRRILGVYYEQNVTTEQYERYDGERWEIHAS